jgi:hypothetical protein
MCEEMEKQRPDLSRTRHSLSADNGMLVATISNLNAENERLETNGERLKKERDS